MGLEDACQQWATAGPTDRLAITTPRIKQGAPHVDCFTRGKAGRRKIMKARLASTIHCSIRDLIKRRVTAILACFGVLILMAIMVRAPFSSAQTSESINTFASDCATSKTTFNLGDPVCAVATDAL